MPRFVLVWPLLLVAGFPAFADDTATPRAPSSLKAPGIDAETSPTAPGASPVASTAEDAQTPKSTAEATRGPSGSSAAAPAKERTRVLVLDLEAKGVDPDTAQTISNLVVVTLAEVDPTLDVIGGADVRNLVALEGERQALGCSADTSCIAEIAGALGAELSVFGQIGRLGSLTLITLSLFDTKAAKAVGRVSVEAKSAEELPAKIREAVTKLLTPRLVASGRTVNVDDTSSATSEPADDDSSSSEASASIRVQSEITLWPFAVMGAGAVAAMGGVVVIGVGYALPAVLLVMASDVNAPDLDAAKNYQGVFASGIPTAAVYGGTALIALGLVTGVAGGVFALTTGGDE